MLREIIKPTSEFYNIHIPKEYINREIEILVLPFSYKQKVIEEYTEKKYKSLLGSLKKYANSALIENEKDIAWASVAKNKNAIS